MKIAILCFWIILTRVGYYFLIQGTHEGLYYMQMSNLKDICQYLGVAGLLFLCYNKQIAPKMRYVIIFTIIYCLSFACIMLYPFFGPDVRRSNESVMLTYNVFWACALAVLIIYIAFDSEKFSTKGA
jgi:magnesium-transporting ATPase (P-type)